MKKITSLISGNLSRATRAAKGESESKMVCHPPHPTFGTKRPTSLHIQLAFRRKSKMFSLHVIRSDTLASAQLLQTAQTPFPSVAIVWRNRWQAPRLPMSAALTYSRASWVLDQVPTFGCRFTPR